MRFAQISMVLMVCLRIPIFKPTMSSPFFNVDLCNEPIIFVEAPFIHKYILTYMPTPISI